MHINAAEAKESTWKSFHPYSCASFSVLQPACLEFIGGAAMPRVAPGFCRWPGQGCLNSMENPITSASSEENTS